jgi:hypothetical protein
MLPRDEGYRLWFQTLATAQPTLLQPDAQDTLRNNRGRIARAGFDGRN